MRAWLLLLGGLIVWAIQFFALYILASVFGSSPAARIGTALVTLPCLAATLWLVVHATRALRTASDRLDRWMASVAAAGAALAMVAILWQGLPALIG